MDDRTHDGDTMPTNTSIPLEHDIRTLVDSNTIVLAVNGTGRELVGRKSQGSWRYTHLSSIVRSVVLTSKPSVL